MNCALDPLMIGLIIPREVADARFAQLKISEEDWIDSQARSLSNTCMLAKLVPTRFSNS